MPRKLPEFPDTLKGPGIGPLPTRIDLSQGLGLLSTIYVPDFDSEAGKQWTSAFAQKLVALAEFCGVSTQTPMDENWWRTLALELATRVVPAFSRTKAKRGRPAENDSADARHARELLLQTVEQRVRGSVTENAVLERIRRDPSYLPAWFQSRHQDGTPSKSTLAAALKRAREERAQRLATTSLFGLSQSSLDGFRARGFSGEKARSLFEPDPPDTLADQAPKK